MFPRFSLRNVREAFLPRDFERGRRYFEEGRVRAFDLEERDDGTLSLRGEVRGSARYTQEVDLEWRGDMLDVFSSCTCPIGADCKHVVAVCLMARRYLASAADADDGAADERLRRWLGRVVQAADGPVDQTDAGSAKEQLFYVLNLREGDGSLLVDLRAVRRRADGHPGRGRPVRLDRLTQAVGRPACVGAGDHEALRLLVSLCPEVWNVTPEFRGRLGFLALQQMLATGRCVLGSSDGPAFAWGDPRDLDLRWQETSQGRLSLEMNAGGAVVLSTEPALYVDAEQALLGPVETGGLSAGQLAEVRSAPGLLAGDAATLARLLTNEFPTLALPLPPGAQSLPAERHELVPALTLACDSAGDVERHVLLLGFDYGGHSVPALPATLHSLVDTADGPRRLQRDADAEAAALDHLQTLGFATVGPRDQHAQHIRLSSAADSLVESAGRWSVFVQEEVPELQRNGWQVSVDPSFRLSFEPGDWHADVAATDDDNDWFALRFDLEVGGRQVPLLPLLVPLLRQGFDGPLPQRISLPLAPTEDGGSADGRYVDLPGARLQPFLEVLRDLFGAAAPRGDTVALSRFDAGTVTRLQEAGTRVQVPPRFAALGQRLADFSGIEPVTPPPGLRATLRQYQQHGLDWLQFLRAYDLGGVLADDMGLGKTIQTLAHVLVEKTSGRLDLPVLIVAPTSLMSNWRREAARFTPELSVVVLQGPERHDAFPHIAEHDLVLTTYPLLPRDQQVLCAQAYHAVILDEAQMVKNPRSRAAQVVRSLEARHRLCLTGTPMENHLGELWSQFDFLLPGFLGDEDSFRRHWRRPIEEDGDSAAQQALARRVAPFMLRRRKQDVLDDLPPKTEILRTVALGAQQAALYESVRLTMEDKVRRAIESQGLARSHITILDALLKLRQVCCDPRLLDIDAARSVHASAKLELLMEMLPELLEEGRRVLLFSQFTSMLELIEPQLHAGGISYSKLTGRTRDRDAAVDRFRSGAVDLLLVSLKAGGVGLNLTEADTVILYDPWWNPAVEDQAADRAHRIGQTRGVFVYKLVVESSVEEKILALQARKRALAEGLYASAGTSDDSAFDVEELRSLLL